MNDEFIFYPLKDSPGDDLFWAGNKTVAELEMICKENPECVAFNTLGYMKYSLQDESKFVNLSDGHGMYVNKTRFQKLIKNKIETLLQPQLDLTFVITTCKRLPLLVRTMTQFLLYCQDPYSIKKWICIDDNSSGEDREKMKELYPFFEFVEKSEMERGHPQSINVLLDRVDTKYLIMFEDDWICSKSFTIRKYVELLEEYQNVDQVVLCHRQGIHNDLNIKLNGEAVYEYIYNHYHSVKPELNIEFDKSSDRWSDEKKKHEDSKETYGWWWPGITYNPSVWRMKKFKEVGNVRVDLKPELFEYDHALQCYERGLQVVFTDIGISHIGYDNSAYKKNGFPRYYEV